MSSHTKEQIKNNTKTLVSGPFALLLHNDDVNTFDWVITCLVKVCAHQVLQATQCAFIVHHNGKCDVKRGDLDTLSLMCDQLHAAGLTASIEVVD